MSNIARPNNAPLLTMDEALSALLARARPVSAVEKVETLNALGRIVAEPVASPLAVPPFDNSGMDGYAVACADLDAGGATRLRVAQRIAAGGMGEPLAPGSAARIFTGAPVPPGSDAVVMQEHCSVEGDRVVINHPVPPGANIRRMGEDIAAGAEILAPGTRIRPQEMGLAASVGIGRLPVYRRLRVAVFFTGDELVMPGEALHPGQIYNSNRFVLGGLLQALGCQVTDYGIVPDKLAATSEILARAARDADLVVTSGGVSVGEEDHVKAAVEQVGRLDLWRIAIKPGKPLAFGTVGDAFFVGLPGNPVSALVTFCLLVRPFLLRCQGAREVLPKSYPVRAEFDCGKPDKRREFLRARLGRDAGGVIGATLYPHQGSGVLTSTTWADGLVEIPAGATVRAGEVVRFIPFSELI